MICPIKTFISTLRTPNPMAITDSHRTLAAFAWKLIEELLLFLHGHMKQRSPEHKCHHDQHHRIAEGKLRASGGKMACSHSKFGVATFNKRRDRHISGAPCICSAQPKHRKLDESTSSIPSAHVRVKAKHKKHKTNFWYLLVILIIKHS